MLADHTDGALLLEVPVGKDHVVMPGPGDSLELRMPCPPWRFAALVEPARVL